MRRLLYRLLSVYHAWIEERIRRELVQMGVLRRATSDASIMILTGEYRSNPSAYRIRKRHLRLLPELPDAEVPHPMRSFQSDLDDNRKL